MGATDQRLDCYCPDRFIHQVGAMRWCEPCREWVCVDCTAIHREEKHGDGGAE